jgi:hypothetical protein
VIQGSLTMKKNGSKRWTQLKRVVEELRKGGLFYPHDLKERLKIPQSTVKHDLEIGKYIGIFAQERRRGPYRWVDYSPEEPIIHKVIESHFPHGIDAHLQSKYTTAYDPFEEAIEDAAIRTGNDPHDEVFRKLFFKTVRKNIHNDT